MGLCREVQSPMDDGQGVEFRSLCSHADALQLVLCPPASRRRAEPLLAHRPSSIAHRPSSIVHRPSPIAHRPSPIAHRPSSIIPRPSPLVPRPSSLVHRPSSIVPRPSKKNWGAPRQGGAPEYKAGSKPCGERRGITGYAICRFREPPYRPRCFLSPCPVHVWQRAPHHHPHPCCSGSAG